MPEYYSQFGEAAGAAMVHNARQAAELAEWRAERGAQTERPPALHWGRAFHGHEIEDACPCPQAPCGLVDAPTVDQACEQHGWRFAQTTRQGHRADACPANPTAPEA